MVLDVGGAVTWHGKTQDPGDERDCGADGDKYHPKPEEHVNLLVVQVDGQCALNGVPGAKQREMT